jgi:hypothetical protein
MTDRKQRIAVRSADGSPTHVSGSAASPGRELFSRKPVRGLADLQGVGALPRFVDVAALETRAADLRSDGRYEERARAQLEAEGVRPVFDGEGARIYRARVAARAVELRSAVLADTLPSSVEPRARRST